MATAIEARLVGDDDWIGIEELCRDCNLSVEIMIELLQLEMAALRGAEPREWQIPLAELPRVRVATRLMRDLGLNVSGAVLAVELLEMRRHLERRVHELEQLVYRRE